MNYLSACRLVAVGLLFVLLLSQGDVSRAYAANSAGIELVSIADVFLEIEGAHSIKVTAYAMSPRSDMARRLIDAADHGARISVGLDADAFGNAAVDNDALASELALHNIEVHRMPTTHAKIVELDGVVYLSDRNWPADADQQLVVRDRNKTDFGVIDRAISGGRLGASDHLWTKKSDALTAEAGVISARSSGEIDVETESFGAGTPVYDAIVQRARGGDTVRLLIASREYSSSLIEHQAVADLLREHVEVRLTRANEKMAIEGYNVFVGSVNATRSLSNQLEFGISLRDPAMATMMHSQFAREWATAIPVIVPTPSSTGK
jgi:phosphatidylserine/phosphatidylglycerophosphate/cardiolipin synthase-like enzyme